MECKKRVSIVNVKTVKEKSFLYGCRQINDAEDAAGLGKKFLEGKDQECVMVCCLNSAMQPLCLELVSIGTADQCLVGMREVFRIAIISNATGIIVFHNHPSGSVTPSKADIDITKRLQQSGDLLGIKVHDHIIIGEDGNFASLIGGNK